MDDAVASVLAERARLDRSLGGGIAASVIIHGVVTAAAVLAALRHPQRATTPAINIRFAPIARATAPATPLPPAAKPAAPVTKVAPDPKPVVSQTIPIPAATVTKPAKGAPPSPFGRSSRKPADAPAAIAPVTAVPITAAAAIEIPVGSSGVTGLEGGDFPYSVYIERMRNLIGTHWFRPQSGSGTTTVRFTIDRDGSLRDVIVETPSGNASFDRAAERAVREASPLPPLPFGYNGTFLGVHLTFR